jgi:hypothetical protein
MHKSIEHSVGRCPSKTNVRRGRKAWRCWCGGCGWANDLTSKTRKLPSKVVSATAKQTRAKVHREKASIRRELYSNILENDRIWFCLMKGAASPRAK